MQVEEQAPSRSLDSLAIYINTHIATHTKPIAFLGDSLDRLREFSEDAKRDAGYPLDRVQRGLQPDNVKPMPSIGKGVEEIRVRDDTGAYRVICENANVAILLII
ncbi:type II toxin-antitoxin system RelE/ParE family toxin [Xanthomonas hyacinthi]|uniref:Uncharacterized protein n=1 Tax=Xanthomonas hyacinthi TaxID=56455 RepID=A0A2S7EY53_9XANT|nr:type II toxin-antitoxin system RelE/ParE family toxin [Xanthomonas hyacinthi]PPU98082.1 hypothetical protein XhyaCFBP1156_07600 [Xanthomonas hyacinthi]QGY76881.1 type II toxin-antitoxin system RelE/ParE family toxin [Xanthomonas hyacinthi]